MRRFISLLTVMIFLIPTALAVGDVKIIDFSATATNGTVPLHVYFTGNVTGNVTNWHWKFQNEGTGNITYSSANVTALHIFGKPATYDVTLDVRGPGGNDTLVKQAYITVNAPGSNMPIADFSSNITSGSAPLDVQFTDISYNATGWNWNFGDGNNSTEQSTMHTYSEAGNYTVNLTVSNAYGTNSELATINVSAQPVLPVANLSSNVTIGYAPLSVQFNDSSENVTAWNWDFGDGANSTEQSPMHTFSIVGNYTVNLTASNANGTNSKLATIDVLEYNNTSSN
jgi:PKD repeat protein